MTLSAGHLETKQGDNCTRLFKLWQLSVCITETCEQKSNDNLTRQMEHFPNLQPVFASQVSQQQLEGFLLAISPVYNF